MLNAPIHHVTESSFFQKLTTITIVITGTVLGCFLVTWIASKAVGY